MVVQQPGIGTHVVNSLPTLLPRAYSTFNLEYGDANGGWIMAAADYARFLAAFDLGLPKFI